MHMPACLRMPHTHVLMRRWRMRMHSQVTLEALPQTVLQSYIFVRVVFMGAGGTLDVSLPILLNSLTLSLVNLAKAWLTALFASRELGLSLGVYLNLLLQMFKGLPLEALRSNATDECMLADMRLTPDLVGVLAKVLRDYNTTLKTLDLADCVVLPTELAEDKRRAADTFKELATAIVAHPTLARVRLAAGDRAWFDMATLRGASTMDVRGKELNHPATIALLVALAEASPALETLDARDVELGQDARDALHAAVDDRLRADESVEEAKLAARLGPLLAKVRVAHVDELRGSTSLDWSFKGLDASNADCMAKDLFATGVLDRLTTLKCAPSSPVHPPPLPTVKTP